MCGITERPETTDYQRHIYQTCLIVIYLGQWQNWRDHPKYIYILIASERCAYS